MPKMSANGVTDEPIEGFVVADSILVSDRCEAGRKSERREWEEAKEKDGSSGQFSPRAHHRARL